MKDFVMWASQKLERAYLVGLFYGAFVGSVITLLILSLMR
jgi:hypothetical protein